MKLDKDYKKIIRQIEAWIEKKVIEAGCEGVVIGLSGGIDSSVTAVLCQRVFPKNTFGFILPCQSSSQDREDAVKVADKFGINYETYNLNDTFKTLLKEIGSKEDDKLARANIKPRLRMTVLYYYASIKNSLVVGTDNKSELEIGYFTKHGDGGIDIAPLGGLVKTEVREIARLLEIPEEIITKPPSAGLWEGQTDEDELGISYEELDKYLMTGKAREEVKEKVDKLKEKSRHKITPPPIFKP